MEIRVNSSILPRNNGIIHSISGLSIFLIYVNFGVMNKMRKRSNMLILTFIFQKFTFSYLFVCICLSAYTEAKRIDIILPWTGFMSSNGSAWNSTPVRCKISK
jgi:pilus assembly protein TadC